MTNHHNDHKAYPNLKFEELQNRAKDWIDDFPAVKIEQILLYHHDRRLPKFFNTAFRQFQDWRSLRYVPVFVVSNFPEFNLSNIQEYPMGVEKKDGKLVVQRNNGSDDNYELWEWIHSLKTNTESRSICKFAGRYRQASSF